MLVQTIFLLFAILGGAVDGYKPPWNQNEGSSIKTFSQSHSSSSASQSSSSTFSSSSVGSATPGNCDEDKCDRNSTYKRCPKAYPGTCGNPKGSPNCKKMCKGYGCECNPGYVVLEDEKCVKLDDCPDYLRCNDRNATFKGCPNPCPSTCALPGRVPCNKECIKRGCECKQGFYLNNKNKCVALQDCPGAKTCSANETFAFCKAGCPTNNCPTNDNRGIIACSPPFPCGSGCICRSDYLRSKDDKCILYSDCPPINCTRPNEVYCARPPPCLFEECTDIGKPNQCDRTYPNRPQCVCKPGFYRNKDGICVPKKQCYPPVCGYNEVFSECNITCPPQTCESIFTSYLCSNETVCEPGCNCLDGYLRNGSEICVPSEECFPAPKCDISPECRPTCANPEPNCRLVQLPTNVVENQDGCQCKPGYILSDTYRECIKVEECPGGNPCGPNGTLSECAFRCPNQNCPEDDSREKVACKPGRPCPSGCNCKPYYLRSSDNGTCIMASDCPPRTCTRPNERWNACASECLAESCDDLITKPECYPDPQNCQPQCVCCEEYYRNKSGFCVPKEDCPINCKVKQECRPTCAVPNPPNCPFIPPSNTNIDSCNCQSGYVLSEFGGMCIKIEECAADQPCNGDLNATIKQNPLPCPSTCESPNAFPCKRKSDPIGCECKPGYLKSETGKCILPDECKGGNPCGRNETFSACRYECPFNYCPKDDSRAVLVCETFPFAPCFSGCSCRLSYRRQSTNDPKCILSSECRPVNCTRPNEKWNSCPSACASEYCDAVDSQPTVCNTLVFNCNPRCECKKSYFRNDSDVCVSSRDCRKLNKRKRVNSSYL